MEVDKGSGRTFVYCGDKKGRCEFSRGKSVKLPHPGIPVLTVDGRKLHTVGIPIHFGFKGETKPGYITNTLTPFVGDANTQTPEFKSFLVNVEKA